MNITHDWIGQLDIKEKIEKMQTKLDLKMEIKIKKTHPDAKIPAYAKNGDAAMDLYAVEESWNEDNTMVTYNTGIAMEIPEGYVGLIFPRSSVYRTTLSLSNSVGVIDSGYRGTISAKFRYIEEGHVYDAGDRIAQILILPYPKINFKEVDSLSETDRGAGGYGSTGV